MNVPLSELENLLIAVDNVESLAWDLTVSINLRDRTEALRLGAAALEGAKDVKTILKTIIKDYAPSAEKDAIIAKLNAHRARRRSAKTALPIPAGEEHVTAREG